MFSSRTLVQGFLIRNWVSSIVVRKNPPLAILAIFNARRMSDWSGCTRHACLDIVADMLKTYVKLDAGSKGGSWLALVKKIAFGWNGSVRLDTLHQSHQRHPGGGITSCLASIQRGALYISLQSLFHHFFAVCRSPILIDHSGVVANCDHTLEWVHWVCACIGIAMQWVTL